MHPGPPGAGKSTSAALLAKHHGYVYYEGDCQLSCINPYLDPSIEEPSLAQSQQTPLKVQFPKIFDHLLSSPLIFASCIGTYS